MTDFSPIFQRLNRTKPLSIRLKNALNESIRVNKFEGQESFLSPGNHANSIYYIQSGMLRGAVEGPSEKVTTWFKQEDDLIIPEGIITGSPVNEYITAVVKTTLFSISVNHIQKLLATIPEMSELLLLLLEEKNQESYYREQLLRLPTARDRYNAIAKNQDFILKRVPHYLIASYLNVTKETFSRLHKGLSY